ncbi:MAG: hypothetical protein H7A25_21870 [Leptospiraceae bacterium]|nr:hypothetical protein [Leptospiraceae bacterium]MCP5502562.1 hypothetical protein [Leptospiraceae bacterium]
MKPKIGVFSLSCCEGCELMILNLEDELLDILNLVEFVNFREAMDIREDEYDIAFVEGSVETEEDIEHLKEIRDNAKILIALGSCAWPGGVNTIKNNHDLDEASNYVYGDKADWYPTRMAEPIDHFVRVDYYIKGCPIDKKEFIYYLQCLLNNQIPKEKDYPVCYECKQNGSICVFEKGMQCMGPLTRGGCLAVCPKFGNYCWGCRGPLPGANIEVHKATLAKHGLSQDEIKKRISLLIGGASLEQYE